MLETLETRALLSGETVPLTGTYTTPAAAAEAAAGTFPAQWTWDPGDTVRQPLPATGGTPLVKQYRNGQLIGTYSILGGGTWGQPDSYLNPYAPSGPFSRSPYRNWADGDLFEVYPAVYSGVNNQPWIGPMFDNDAEYSAGVSHTPTNITIRGVTVDGVRPVIKLDAAGGSHEVWPLFFYYPMQLPGSPSFPVRNVSIQRNVFVGYRDAGDPALDYRGDQALIAGFADINPDFSLKTNYVPADTSIVGTPAYGHEASIGKTRQLATVGARDSAGGPVSSASISGYVWNDRNGSGAWNRGELPLSGWTVYLDANNNGKLDSGERRTLTDARGFYQFSSLAAGSYKVRQVLKSGWRMTCPTGGSYTLTLVAGQSVQGQAFGDKRVGSLAMDVDFYPEVIRPTGRRLHSAVEDRT